MKCPLLCIGIPSEITHSEPTEADCIKEECAWWDIDSSACAIWAIMSSLDALGKLFRKIEQKMPHAEQFTK